MSQSGEITACGLTIRPREHVVVVNGAHLDLTPREFEILACLAEHPGWVVSAEQLSSAGGEDEYSAESVSVLVSRLRHKFARAGARDVIETVRGYGYRLHVAQDDVGGEEIGDATNRSLHAAAWRLQEAVLEADHSGDQAQREAAIDALEAARRAIYAALAK